MNEKQTRNIIDSINSQDKKIVELENEVFELKTVINNMASRLFDKTEALDFILK